MYVTILCRNSLYIFFWNGIRHCRSSHTQPSICQQLKLAGMDSFSGVWTELTYMHCWVCSSGSFNQDQTQCCKWGVWSAFIWCLPGDTHQVLLEEQDKNGYHIIQLMAEERNDCPIMNGHWVAKLYRLSWRWKTMDSTTAIVPRANLGLSEMRSAERVTESVAANKTCSFASTKSLLGIDRD